LILATRNAGKARELAVLLQGIAPRIESLREHPDVDLPAETGTTYGENALRKARAVHAALGLPALGDDSGIEVDALEGAPGIRSARYAGEAADDSENNARLLDALAGRSADNRTARFRCVLALVGPGGERVVEGTCEGRILEAPRGDRGFGYDPLFLPEGETHSFAQLPPDVKNRISHRARAAAALRAALGV
jgi:XTP/dITP diphosphohydrolase